MDKFYIDRAFGQAIFVDVENGLVVNCYNETEKFNNKMNEIYKGKPISFLKTDFEERMKPCYHNVRSLSVCTVLKKIDAIKSKKGNLYNLISGLGYENSRIVELKATIKEYELEQSELEQKLLSERNRMVVEHDYNFPI